MLGGEAFSVGGIKRRIWRCAFFALGEVEGIEEFRGVSRGYP